MRFSTQAVRRRKTLGLTLAEVLVAIFITVVGISGVTSVLWWGLQKQDHGKLISEASNLGRIILENIIIQGAVGLTPNTTTWPGTASGLNDAAATRHEILAAPIPFSVINTMTEHLGGASASADHHNIFSNIDRFRRNISVERLGVDNSTSEGRLCRMTVAIYYQDGAYEGRVLQEAVFPHGKEN